MVRLAGKFVFWAGVYVVLSYLLGVVLGLSVQAWLPVLVTVVLAVFWSKVIGPWYSRGTEELRQKNRAARIERERLEAEAHARIAAFDDALTQARGGYVHRSAFDAETQAAMGMPRYHTHYVSPEQQRWMEEWFPDEEGNPSIKAGVHVRPVKITGPERIDAPPPGRGFVIPHDELIRVQPSQIDGSTHPSDWRPAFCRYCGAARGGNDRYCGACGEQLDTRYF